MLIIIVVINSEGAGASAIQRERYVPMADVSRASGLTLRAEDDPVMAEYITIMLINNKTAGMLCGVLLRHS